MSSQDVKGFMSSIWDEQIVPRLVEYIKIPNKSPLYDAKWAEHGYMDQAVALMEQWARAQPIQGMKLEVVRLPGRTPLIFIDIPGGGGQLRVSMGIIRPTSAFAWARDTPGFSLAMP